VGVNVSIEAQIKTVVNAMLTPVDRWHRSPGCAIRVVPRSPPTACARCDSAGNDAATGRQGTRARDGRVVLNWRGRPDAAVSTCSPANQPVGCWIKAWRLDTRVNAWRGEESQRSDSPKSPVVPPKAGMPADVPDPHAPPNWGGRGDDSDATIMMLLGRCCHCFCPFLWFLSSCAARQAGLGVTHWAPCPRRCGVMPVAPCLRRHMGSLSWTSDLEFGCFLFRRPDWAAMAKTSQRQGGYRGPCTPGRTGGRQLTPCTAVHGQVDGRYLRLLGPKEPI